MSSGTRHPDVGALLRLLDGEPEEVDVRQHVAGCPECGRKMEALSGWSERLDDALRAADVLIEDPTYDREFLATLAAGSEAEARRRRRRHRPASALRWAAAVAVLSALVAVSPVRAWMVRGAEAVWVWITDGRDESPTGPVDAGPGSTEVVTAVRGSVLTLRLSGTATPDSLVFRATSELRARAMLRGGAGGGELLVRTDGFEVRGSEGGGTVEVWAPPSVAEVRVTREGNELGRRSRGEEPDWSWRLRVPGTASGPGV